MPDFSGIKEGDEVFVPGQYNIGGKIERVAKVTPTTFSAGHLTFHKKNGCQRGGSEYSRVCAQVPTDQLRAKVMRETTIEMMRRGDVHTLSDDQLAAIRKILDEPRKPKTSK